MICDIDNRHLRPDGRGQGNQEKKKTREKRSSGSSSFEKRAATIKPRSRLSEKAERKQKKARRKGTEKKKGVIFNSRGREEGDDKVQVVDKKAR